MLGVLVYSWIDGIGYRHKCRIMAVPEDRLAVAYPDPGCTNGTIEWHYPTFDSEGLQVDKYISLVAI